MSNTSPSNEGSIITQSTIARQSSIRGSTTPVCSARRFTIVGETKSSILTWILPFPAVDVDPRFGLLVREPGAVALVRPQLDDLDAVHPFLPRRWRFHSWSHACAASSDPEADDRHVPIVPGPSLELQPDLLEVRWRERVRERRDLHERLAERPVEEPVRSGALDPDVFNREVDPSSC